MAFAALGLFLVAGCAAAPSSVPVSPQATSEPRDSVTTVTTPTTVVNRREAIDVAQLLRRANAHAAAGRREQAIADYTAVVEHDANGNYRRAAFIGWGATLDALGDLPGAVELYERYLAEAPSQRQRDEIAVRLVRLLVYLEDWSRAGALAASVGLSDLRLLDQIAVHGALALRAVHTQKLEQALLSISRGRALLDALGIDRAVRPPPDVAALYFALGEVRRIQAARIRLGSAGPPFVERLERRCQLILDSQSAYSEAMRVGMAHWSAMAGVRVGELYQRLHEELMASPPPSLADSTERRALFEAALRLRYSILLDKAVAMMRSTVAMVERTAEPSAWKSRAEAALLDLERAQRAEQAAIAASGYTRGELGHALDDLVKRSRQMTPGASGGS